MANNIPHEVSDMANQALADIVPEKSRKLYEMAHASFVEWRNSNSVTETNEVVLLAYFKKLSEKYKPTTLWSQYSMLKSMLQLKERINLENFLEVAAFLKKKSHGYEPKKSKVFSAENVETFLKTAPDNCHLDKKVIMIFGIFGALRSDELVKVKVQDVTRQGELYHVKVPVTKTMKSRSFVISGEFCSYIEKYKNLRPTGIANDRFFLNFQNGKCTIQVIGKHKFANTPQKIAEFLKLEDPEEYTGHSFRRTSATILVDAGADLTVLKRHGGWKSSTVAEGYIDESMRSKKDVSSLYCNMINLPSTTDNGSNNISPKCSVENAETSNSAKRQKTDVENNSPNSKSALEKLQKDKNLHFENCNVTIHFQ